MLSRAPTAKDVEAFFRRFHRALEVRGLKVRGVTTDGSTLYPEPIAAAFGDVPHQVCTFHVLRELTRAALGAVAKVRKELTAGQPKLGRGRPTKAARRLARRKKRIEQKVGALFEHRYLFVRRRLSPAERRTLLRITRGLPQLRVLRELMEEVYRLFDRRCRTKTALAKLAKLRARLRRFGRLARGAEEAAGTRPGEGAGVPGRAAAGGDVERGGAWEPPIPQDAEDGLSGADTPRDRGAVGLGPTAGAPGGRSVRDDPHPPQGAGSVRRRARFPCYSVRIHPICTWGGMSGTGGPSSIGCRSAGGRIASPGVPSPRWRSR